MCLGAPGQNLLLNPSSSILLTANYGKRCLIFSREIQRSTSHASILKYSVSELLFCRYFNEIEIESRSHNVTYFLS